MCGRYFVSDETAREIEKLTHQIDEKLRAEKGRDIHPSDMAPVLVQKDKALSCAFLRWGFPASFRKEGGTRKQLLFNARSETALKRPAFRESVLKRRAVIPAAWFYEWSREKEKNIFRKKGEPVLFMAGCYNCFEDGEHFVILTTAANPSVAPVHDRMPLVLERGEVGEWISDDSRTESILHKTPCILEREYEQMRLF